MKNKVKLNNYLFKSFILSIILIICFLIIHAFEYRIYTKNYNEKLSSIVSIIEEKYPNVTEEEIIEILNSSSSDIDIFKKYNIDIENDSIIIDNQNEYCKSIVIDSIFLFIMTLILVMLFLRFNRKKDKEIEEITKYIEEINKKNYTLHIDEISEDELSILKNEIYKTTIMLKEQAENSTKEKLELKKSLEDISHQLKTPLTSILIILDNLLDDENMDEKTREEFIFDIRREISNINFLVQNLLKLSKLDTNTVKFDNKEVSLKDIVLESIKKLQMLCELKNIKFNFDMKDDVKIWADFNWQVESISNILKNCIEHSNQSGVIDILVNHNKVYSEVIIKDYGTGISKEDLPHIFERFYKGENSKDDSIGIGLALAKSIVEKSNGKVLVESKKGEGTTFKIKYY